MRRFALAGLLIACPAPPAPAPAPAPEPEPAPAPAPAPAPDRGRPKLTVATYNILAAQGGLPDIVDVLRDTGADLIALQEVDRRTRRSGRVDQPARIAEALQYEVFFSPHRRYDGGEIGVALLSKHLLRKPRRIGVRGSSLGILGAEVELPDAVVHVFVVHFHPTDLRDSRREQAIAQALREREAEAAVRAATAAPRPTVVLGDMNDWPGTPTYTLFRAHFADACAKTPLATFPSAPLPLVRIDYVWASRHFEPTRCRTIATRASDHVPVVVDLAAR